MVTSVLAADALVLGVGQGEQRLGVLDRNRFADRSRLFCGKTESRLPWLHQGTHGVYDPSAQLVGHQWALPIFRAKLSCKMQN